MDWLLLKFPGKQANSLNFLLLQVSDLFFRSVLSNMQKVYLSRNPTAEKILDLVHSYDGDHICFDHFAFRTFGVSTSLIFSWLSTCSVLHNAKLCDFDYCYDNFPSVITAGWWLWYRLTCWIFYWFWLRVSWRTKVPSEKTKSTMVFPSQQWWIHQSWYIWTFAKDMHFWTFCRWAECSEPGDTRRLLNFFSLFV